jgi:copper/silver efflux system protein
MFTDFLLLMIRFRKIVFLVAAAWAFIGIWIAWSTPIDVLPDLSENQVLVYTPWSSHNPPEIHSKITQPLSEFLKDIPGVVTVRGSSDVGFSLLYIIFDDSIGFHEARQRVSDRLAKSSVVLPDGLMAELAPEGIPTGQIVWYTLSGCDTDLLELRSWQERFVAPRLSKIPGVAQVASVGGFLPEAHIDLDTHLLSKAGLTLSDVERQLRNLPLAKDAGESEPIQTSRLTLEIARLENQLLKLPDGAMSRLGELGRVSLQPAPRYGVLEKDGNEMVAGIVHLQAGENPLKVTHSVLSALQTIGDQLPRNLRLSSCYDRTRLISGAVSTVTKTLLEALIIATVCIVLIMRHFRTTLVISLTMPLAVLGPFIGMRILSGSGVNLHVNIMSLAGIAISIGVLVDASVVIVENVTHQLKRSFGENPVVGDTDKQVARATAMVARPAILAVSIMLISFLPIFALRGIDGQLIRPLAWTKTLTLLSVIVLTVTLVPALCRELIRGRLRGESESKILQNLIRIYQPVLFAVCKHPWPLFVLYGGLIILASVALGNSIAIRLVVAILIGTTWLVVDSIRGRIGLSMGLILLALMAQSTMRPIGLAMRLPLDERMVMDMPITLPRMNMSQASDDLKARNMQLCRFPEVQMVVGKAGRAETAFDPAPIDMIESMVEFRPIERWPRRRLLPADAQSHATMVVRKLMDAELVEKAQDETHLIQGIVEAGLPKFDAIQRELCWHLTQSFETSLGAELTTGVAISIEKQAIRNHLSTTPLEDVQIRGLANSIDPQDQLRLAQQLDANALHIVARELLHKLAQSYLPTSISSESIGEFGAAAEATLLSQLQSLSAKRWSNFVRLENNQLYRRAGSTWTQIVVDELCVRQAIIDPDFERTRSQIASARYGTERHSKENIRDHHNGLKSFSELAIIDPHAMYDSVLREMTDHFDRTVWLWEHSRATLTAPGGELDVAVQMPGWANVWTRPIQNRIDMLTTGISSEIGVRVLGDDFESVVATADKIAESLKQIPGAVDIIADPIRNKDYVLFDLDWEGIANRSLERGEIDRAIEAATNGILLVRAEKNGSGSTLPVRLNISGNREATSDLILDMPMPFRTRGGIDKEHKAGIEETKQDESAQEIQLLKLRDVAKMRHQDGPATIKSTNGKLCNYVRLNVRGSTASEVVLRAKSMLEQMTLAPGITIEWTGQFEHAARTRLSMMWMLPLCFFLIAILLFWAFRDFADALLMLLSVPGALSGAVLMQWLLGYSFSLAVGVGYIACFGMAAATSMVMIIYLRQALAEAGGLEKISSIDELKSCVVSGAVHRLRPKLLTEATMILSLAPLLWSTGVGADVICPMAAPVLGGILVADEVVDLLIPSIFFAIRRKRWLRRMD